MRFIVAITKQLSIHARHLTSLLWHVHSAFLVECAYFVDSFGTSKWTFTGTNRLAFLHLIYDFQSMTDMNWFCVYPQAVHNLVASIQCFGKVPPLRLSTQTHAWTPEM
eukprot:SAG31_NODE_19468_length_600_cov_72.618762_1_plen_108_part_00